MLAQAADEGTSAGGDGSAQAAEAGHEHESEHGPNVEDLMTFANLKVQGGAAGGAAAAAPEALADKQSEPPNPQTSPIVSFWPLQTSRCMAALLLVLMLLSSRGPG
jgi:hypothetical protein